MTKELIYKQTFSLVILTALFVQTFDRDFVVADYYTNTEVYAKYCVNKSKPLLHCNGKCQMFKKLKEEDKKDNQNPERKSESKNDLTLSANFFPKILIPLTVVIDLTEKSMAACEGALLKRSYAIFHPPQFGWHSNGKLNLNHSF